MASKAVHLKAIKALRMDWTEADALLAGQLAAIRANLDRLRKQAESADATVPTAAGGEKPNPLFAGIDRIARQEASLTRRLGLGLKRTAGGQYQTATSPTELRADLWEYIGEDCRANLVPSMWLSFCMQSKCDIPEDYVWFPNNPLEMPEPGKAPIFATDFEALGPDSVPASCGMAEPGMVEKWRKALANERALRATKPGRKRVKATS